MKLSCLAKEFTKETRNAIKLLLENKNFLMRLGKEVVDEEFLMVIQKSCL